MKTIRTIIAGGILSLTLLGSAVGVTNAADPGTFGTECVSHMARMHSGVGPHVREMHGESTVGAHLQEMRTENSTCMMGEMSE